MLFLTIYIIHFLQYLKLCIFHLFILYLYILYKCAITKICKAIQKSFSCNKFYNNIIINNINNNHHNKYWTLYLIYIKWNFPIFLLFLYQIFLKTEVSICKFNIYYYTADINMWYLYEMDSLFIILSNYNFVLIHITVLNTI